MAVVSRSQRSSYQPCTQARTDVLPGASGPTCTGARHRPSPATCSGVRTPSLPRRCVQSTWSALSWQGAHTGSMAAAAAAAAVAGASTEWCPAQSHTVGSSTRIGGRSCQGSGSSEHGSRAQRYGCCIGCSPSMVAAPPCGRRRVCWVAGVATFATPIAGPRPQVERGEATAASLALSA